MEHWSKYWHTAGVLNSFAEGDANSGYSGDLKKFWEQALAKAPQGAVIVDIGTGNGALALLANDVGITNQKDFVVHGIDAATIDPVKQFEKSPALAKKLKKIKFHSQTPVEKLPFESNSVDLFIGQFAFEYAERDAALAETLSALKSGGQMTLMIHHSSSELVKNSKIGADVLDYILQQTPLFQQADMLIDLASQAIPQLGEQGWADYPHNRILTQSIQWTMQILQEKFSKPAEQSYVNDVVRRIARIFEALTGKNLDACTKALAYEYHTLNDHRLRLQDQLNAALTKKDATALVKAAEKAGATASIDVFELEGSPFGWTLTLSK